jgi:hypothetical protein
MAVGFSWLWVAADCGELAFLAGAVARNTATNRSALRKPTKKKMPPIFIGFHIRVDALGADVPVGDKLFCFGKFFDRASGTYRIVSIWQCGQEIVSPACSGSNSMLPSQTWQRQISKRGSFGELSIILRGRASVAANEKGVTYSRFFTGTGMPFTKRFRARPDWARLETLFVN